MVFTLFLLMLPKGMLVPTINHPKGHAEGGFNKVGVREGPC